MTTIKTKHQSYSVERIEWRSPKTGKLVPVGHGEIIIRARSTASGRLHTFDRERAGRPRFDAALAHFLAPSTVTEDGKPKMTRDECMARHPAGKAL
jgi:hypothetical protein